MYYTLGYYMLGCMLGYCYKVMLTLLKKVVKKVPKILLFFVHSLQHVLHRLTPAHPFKPTTEPPLALH
jgi:hypothetical protein